MKALASVNICREIVWACTSISVTNQTADNGSNTAESHFPRIFRSKISAIVDLPNGNPQRYGLIGREMSGLPAPPHGKTGLSYRQETFALCALPQKKS